MFGFGDHPPGGPTNKQEGGASCAALFLLPVCIYEKWLIRYAHSSEAGVSLDIVTSPWHRMDMQCHRTGDKGCFRLDTERSIGGDGSVLIAHTKGNLGGRALSDPGW